MTAGKSNSNNGFWSVLDVWGKRVLLMVAAIGLLGGSFVAWARLDDRVAANTKDIATQGQMLEQVSEDVTWIRARMEADEEHRRGQ